MAKKHFNVRVSFEKLFLSARIKNTEITHTLARQKSVFFLIGKNLYLYLKIAMIKKRTIKFAKTGERSTASTLFLRIQHVLRIKLKTLAAPAGI